MNTSQLQIGLELPAGSRLSVRPLKGQLLKWIGNKQRFAQDIAKFFPPQFNRYFEPFLGSGAVLATWAPNRAIASDTFEPLFQIWDALSHRPETLKAWYGDRWHQIAKLGKQATYEKVRSSYNGKPNGADLVFLCRACYGGVVRFRKSDGYMSTPCGIHDPISPESFSWRVDEWHHRVQGTTFLHSDYREAMKLAKRGDLVYCDPPYSHSQAILYGSQDFELEALLAEIEACKTRGVYVALSIDGKKKSGDVNCALPIPRGLFKREVFIHIGRSMLRRFQLEGQTLEAEHVHDRLLLTY